MLSTEDRECSHGRDEVSISEQPLSGASRAELLEQAYVPERCDTTEETIEFTRLSFSDAKDEMTPLPSSCNGSFVVRDGANFILIDDTSVCMDADCMVSPVVDSSSSRGCSSLTSLARRMRQTTFVPFLSGCDAVPETQQLLHGNVSHATLHSRNDRSTHQARQRPADVQPSGNGSDAAASEVYRLTEAETRKICVWKVFLIFMILALATVVSVGAYKFLDSDVRQNRRIQVRSLCSFSFYFHFGKIAWLNPL
jgi:hypothetical protein